MTAKPIIFSRDRQGRALRQVFQICEELGDPNDDQNLRIALSAYLGVDWESHSFVKHDDCDFSTKPGPNTFYVGRFESDRDSDKFAAYINTGYGYAKWNGIKFVDLVKGVELYSVFCINLEDTEYQYDQDDQDDQEDQEDQEDQDDDDSDDDSSDYGDDDSSDQEQQQTKGKSKGRQAPGQKWVIPKVQQKGVFDGKPYKQMMEALREKHGNKSLDILKEIVSDPSKLSILANFLLKMLKFIYEKKLEKYQNYRKNSLPTLPDTSDVNESSQKATNTAYKKTFDKVLRWRDDLYKPNAESRIQTNLQQLISVFDSMVVTLKHKNDLISNYLFDLNPISFMTSPTTFQITAAAGTGKTFLAENGIARFFDLVWLYRGTFVNKPVSELFSRFMNGTTGNMSELFINNMESVIFLDEIHGVLKNKMGGEEMVGSIIASLQARNAGLFGLVVAGYPGEVQKVSSLDQGWARRFKHKININKLSARAIIGIIMSTFGTKLDEYNSAMGSDLYPLNSSMITDTHKRCLDTAGRFLSEGDRLPNNADSVNTFVDLLVVEANKKSNDWKSGKADKINHIIKSVLKEFTKFTNTQKKKYGEIFENPQSVSLQLQQQQDEQKAKRKAKKKEDAKAARKAKKAQKKK